jgi:SNF2 family DNA or RNA helicase
VKILRDYQKTGRDFLLRTEIGGCLFVEMRLGKTLIAIRYAKRLLWEHPDGKILIIGPNSTHAGWISDLADEGHTPVLIRGSVKQKEKALTQPGTFYLLNKEGHVKGARVLDKKTGKMKTKWKALAGLLETKWLLVILDESHFIKNPQSNVSKFFTKNFLDVPYKLCLTGTPLENNELDFIQQYLFILGRRAPFDYWKFRSIFTKRIAFNFFITRNGKLVLDEISKSIAFCLRRKDVHMDKEKIFEVRQVELPPDARKVYQQVEKEFVLEFQNERRITKYIIEQYSILNRICGGFVPVKNAEGIETKAKPTPIHEAKLKELFELLDDNFKNESVVIFATYISELEAIFAYLTKRKMKCCTIHGGVKIGEDRWNIVKDFNRGKFNRLIVQPDSVKEGVDLSVASTAIYFSLPRGYILWKQTQDRILSLKKNDSLLIIVLEIKNSIEEDRWKSIEQQTSLENSILNFLHKKQNK